MQINISIFIVFESIESTPPKIRVNSIIKLTNLDNSDPLIIISFVEEITISTRVEKYNTNLRLFEKSIM